MVHRLRMVRTDRTGCLKAAGPVPCARASQVMTPSFDLMGGLALRATRLFQVVRGAIHDAIVRTPDALAKTLRTQIGSRSGRALLQLVLFAVFAALPAVHAATAPGTDIQNTARASFDILGSSTILRDSNQDSLTVVAPPVGATPAVVTFVRPTETAVGEAATLVAGSCAGSGGPVALPLPSLPSGAPIPGSGAIQIVPATLHSAGFTAYVVVDDQDENGDSLLAETVQITISSTLTGDSETITLTETGLDTGRFLGYIGTTTNASASGDCTLGVQVGDVLVGDYTDDDDGSDTAQGPVEVTARTPAVIEFLTYDHTGNSGSSTVGPTSCAAGGDLNSFALLPDPISTRAPGGIDASGAVSLGHADVYHAGDPVFISVGDGDHNTDPLALDTVLVRLTTDDPTDSEVIRLTETGVDTGVFVGYIQSTSAAAVAGDCRISVDDGTQITASYTDDQDGTDTAVGAVLVDPFGVIFDSVTGAPVDGAIVRIVDALTGLPAAVFGDDGVSTFPNPLTSGGDATDSSAAFYDFPAGEYRFPYLLPGTYRLEVTPPAGYLFPSGMADAIIQILPGAPYALITGSRGEDFLLPIGPALNVDIPLDPVATELFVQKTASASVAGIGDFVQFTVTVSNPQTQTAPDTVATDVLPVGFRYMAGSTRIDGALAADPAITSDGRSMSWSLGDVAPGQNIRLTYVVEIAAGTRPGMATNRVTAVSDGAAVSNEATATVTVREDMFSSHGFLVGHVAVGSCDDDVTNDLDGVAGIRIYLEDGRYVVTDEDGLYHFEGLRAGTHVVQMDLDSLPDHLEVVPCEASNRFAGRSFSQFVDLQQGALWRADFYLAQKADETAAVEIALSGALAADELSLDLHLAGGPLPVSNLSVTLLMPEGVDLDGSSLALDGEPLTADMLQAMGPAQVLRLGDRDGDWTVDLAGLARVTAGTEGEQTIKAIVTFSDSAGVLHRSSPLELAVGTQTVSAAPSERVDFSVGVVAAEQPEDLAAFEDVDYRAPPLDAGRLSTIQSGDGFVFPAMDANPMTPTSAVQIAHSVDESAKLYIGGEPVAPMLYDGRVNAGDHHVAISSWRAVRLEEGDNLLRADIIGSDGQVVRSVERVLHFAGVPVRAEFLPERSLLVADGRTVPVIAVQLYDRWGAPARPGVNGDVRIDPPYLSRDLAERDRAQNALANDSRGATYRVSPEGIAFIELDPTTRTGEAVAHISLGQDRRDFEVRARLIAGERDWILVGLAEGTVGYNAVSGNLQSLEDAGAAEDFYDEGRMAFFAKGTISGETLLTVAYDSDRAGTDDMSRLFGIVDPDEYYVIYGDGSEQRFDAASSEKLYVRVDRGTFNAVFGDFDTGLNATELSRFSRRFTGLRSEYGGEVFSFNAFAAESDTSFLRDEIAGDGTSGLYHLSSNPLVINSERVIIETRDRFQGDVIISRETLQRHLDYNIDYLEGTLFFKRPIAARDQDFNPVFIVVEYEVDGNGQGDLVAGGRAEVALADGRVRVGATMVSDSSDQVDGNLQGMDLRVQVNENTEFRAELAQSEADNNGAPTDGSGYRAELIHNGEAVQGRIYTTDIDAGFGLGQQNASGTGTATVGAEGRVTLGENWNLDGQIYTQQLELTGNQREVVELDARYHDEQYGASVGVRHASDEDGAGNERASDQLMLGGSATVMDGRLNLRANTETVIGGTGAGADHPDRATVGADYALTDSTDLFVEQEWARGSTFTSENTSVGLRLRPWTGAEVATTMNRQYSENGARVFANLGLAQRWQHDENWSFDLGLDRAQTLRQPGYAPFDPNHPVASGTATDDYTALTFGANYRAETWQVDNRFEWRDGEQSDKWGIFSGFYREAGQGRGFTASFNMFQTATVAGDDSFFANLRLGAAYRPVDSQWTLFDRLDLIYDNSSSPTSDATSYRIVNNLHANYLLDRHTQLMFQWGAKFVRANFDDFSVNGYTDLWGFGVRRDLGSRWDVGFNLQSLNSWNAGTHDYRVGGSFGYNVAENVWISVGYNVRGFVDTDFSQGDFTAQGPFITFRFKFDQQTLRVLAQGSGYALPDAGN